VLRPDQVEARSRERAPGAHGGRTTLQGRRLGGAAGRAQVVEVAERYGVSSQAVRSWLGCYSTGGLDALAD
jgi:transposase-like protein